MHRQKIEPNPSKHISGIRSFWRIRMFDPQGFPLVVARGLGAWPVTPQDEVLGVSGW